LKEIKCLGNKSRRETPSKWKRQRTMNGGELMIKLNSREATKQGNNQPKEKISIQVKQASSSNLKLVKIKKYFLKRVEYSCSKGWRC